MACRNVGPFPTLPRIFTEPSPCRAGLRLHIPYTAFSERDEPPSHPGRERRDSSSLYIGCEDSFLLLGVDALSSAREVASEVFALGVGFSVMVFTLILINRISFIL